MAFAPDLRAAFLFGEGVHGYVKPNGYYMDDFWADDLQQHRWVCVYPGAHPPTIDLTVKNRSETDKSGNPVPVAQMVHGYEMTAYDSDTKRFLFLPFSADYWRAARGFACRRNCCAIRLSPCPDCVHPGSVVRV